MSALILLRQAMDLVFAAPIGKEGPALQKVRRLALRVALGGDPDGLARAKALRGRNECAFCEEPVRAGRVACAATACRRAYWRAYKRDRNRCQLSIPKIRNLERREPVAQGACP